MAALERRVLATIAIRDDVLRLMSFTCELGEESAARGEGEVEGERSFGGLGEADPARLLREGEEKRGVGSGTRPLETEVMLWRSRSASQMGE